MSSLLLWQCKENYDVFLIGKETMEERSKIKGPENQAGCGYTHLQSQHGEGRGGSLARSEKTLGNNDNIKEGFKRATRRWM